VFPIKII